MGRYRITGYDLVVIENSDNLGRATYVRHDIGDVKEVPLPPEEQKYSVAIKVKDHYIVNTYRPPSDEGTEFKMPCLPHPCVYVGDFNCRHPNYGYQGYDLAGRQLVKWVEANNLTQISDPTSQYTFKSKAHAARIRKENRGDQDNGPTRNGETRPDLIFVTEQNGIVVPAVSEEFTTGMKSQHRCTILKINGEVQTCSGLRYKRYNYQKADWPKYLADMELRLSNITLNLEKTTLNKIWEEAIITFRKVANRHIPRGRAVKHVSGFNERCVSPHGVYKFVQSIV